ncbi:MAG: hypothetical protein H6Q88_3097 [Anaeromyxobacteraceae bacterium]|jgi:Ni/Co efflux regulator RcnB|nr:hypothetical protein [Anaeromyxobacteraceae bacterium]
MVRLLLTLVALAVLGAPAASAASSKTPRWSGRTPADPDFDGGW